MLRLVLLVLYLIASSSDSRQTEQGGGLDPLGLTALPLASTADAGAGNDPNGASSPPSTGPTSDAGAGNDPDG
jgi:hypothetical protein